MSDESFNARRHDVVTKRSAKGATSQRVTHYGIAPVIGRTDVDVRGLPMLADATPDDTPNVAAARALSIAAQRTNPHDGPRLRSRTAGVNAFDVLSITQAIYGNLIDPLLGTDGIGSRSFAQVVHADRSAYSACAVRQGALSDGAHPDSDRAILAASGTVYVSHTSRLPWAPRYRIAMGADRGGETRVRATKRTHVVVRHRLVTGRQVFDVVEIAAPTDTPSTHRFVGHRKVARPAPAKRGKRVSVKRAARTVGHAVDTPATVDGWCELVGMLNRGERLTVGDHVTVTRGKGGKLRATDRRGDTPAYWETRTADALAIRLTV